MSADGTIIVKVLAIGSTIYAVGEENVTRIEFLQSPNSPEPFFKFFANNRLLFEVNARFVIRVDYV